MTPERTEARELEQAPESGSDSPARSIPNPPKPNRWIRRLLAHVALFAALGTILGAIIGAVSYTPDQTGLVFFSQGEMAAFGAFTGFMLGALAGLMVWVMRTLRRRFAR
jgi:hypothetical protein